MAAARPRAWMPLYWPDFLADTAHLSAAESGAYLLLIGHYWLRGGPLPDDDRQLARIARMSPEEWSNAKALLEQFFSIEEAQWKHARIEYELAESAAKYEKRAAAGRKGGRGRKSPRPEPDTKQSESNAQAALNQPQPQPPLKSPVETEGDPDPVFAAAGAAEGTVSAVDGYGYKTKRGHLLKDAALDRFEQFWGAYGYKAGKSEAAEVWWRLEKDGTAAAALPAILAGATREAKARPGIVRAGRTPKMAEGWLSGRRWEDEHGAGAPPKAEATAREISAWAAEKRRQTNGGH